MENINDIYEKYSKINPYNGVGLGEKCIKSIKNKNPNGNYHTIYYFVPSWLSDYKEDRWIGSSYIKRHLNPDVSFQIYYDLIYLGISKVEDRPKCEFCNKESKFSSIKKYHGYCEEHRYNHIAKINSAHFKGVPLTEETRRKLSLAKKGKKLTEEQRLRRPRGYHFKHSQETKDKLSRMKKGKVRSRSYYKSGTYETKKCKEPITYLSSYERDFLKICDYSKLIVSIEIPDPIEYKIAGGNHNYYPDFLITTDSGMKIIIEIKAYNMLYDKKVLVKKYAAKKWCRKNGMKYIILTEKDIYLKNLIRGERILNRSFRIYDYV
jgi:hypothetical protein